MDKNELKDYIYSLAYTPVFEDNYFDIKLPNGLPINYVSSNEPLEKMFFTVKTYYDNVVDISKKIQISVASAMAQCEDAFDDSLYNPFEKPSQKEIIASYLAENALFRVLILWDILAQVYNVMFKCELPEDKIHYQRLFHNKAQEKEPYAEEIYSYLSEKALEEDPASSSTEVFYKGNHKFLVDTRNSFAHRFSPNVSVVLFSEHRLRIPAYYLFRRSLEDYYIVCDFLNGLFVSMHREFLEKQDNPFLLGLMNPSKSEPREGKYIIL